MCLSDYWQWILVNGHIGISAVIVKKCIATKSNTPALQYHVHIMPFVHWSGELSINPAFHLPLVSINGLAKSISRSVYTTFAFYGNLLFLKTLFSCFSAITSGHHTSFLMNFSFFVSLDFLESLKWFGSNTAVFNIFAEFLVSRWKQKLMK